MKTLLWIVSLVPLAAQQPTPTAPAQTTPAPTTPAPATPAATTPLPAAAVDTKTATPSPVPAEAPAFTGWIDLGYRWDTGVGGSFDTYRSFVNLGSGPKLIGTEFSLTDPKHRLFDVIHVRAYNWGDDPNESLHLDAKKAKAYEFNADYHDMAYFNYLPSYADPLLSRGIILDEQSFDMRRHFANFSLDLLPGNWIVPYLNFESDSGSGLGVTTFVSNGYEYPEPNTLSDSTNLYRGGVRIELRRFHATLEEGRTTFKNNQNVFQAPGTLNLGNLPGPAFGETLDLTSLLAAYGIRGTSTFSKALFTANPASWIDLYGQFLYSEPNSKVNYQASDTGNLLLQSQVLFYTSEQFLLSAAAKLPHTTGSAGAEIRPFRGVRLVESWLTDRLHNSASSTSADTMASAGFSEQTAALLAASLASNQSQQETDVFWDATSRLTLHGGYRYVWGEASDAILPLEGLSRPEEGKLRRNVGLGGFTFRPLPKLTLSGDAEGGSSGGVYFRTSLYDYQKARARARYQITGSFSLSADFNLLNNHDPLPGVESKYLAHQEGLSFLWAPSGGKNWSIQGSYDRSTLRSEIPYLIPEFLSPAESLYRDNSHTASGMFTTRLKSYKGLTPKFSAGGSFFISNGSRPASYYQPLAKLFVPLSKKLAWFAEWSYYGYGEAFYLYEGFRTHLVTTGLRFSR